MRALLIGLLFAGAIAASAANFSGKWVLPNPVGRGGGRGAPTIVTLNQAGNSVTGTISVRVDPGTNSPVYTEIWGGQAEGDSLSFYVWTGLDQPAKTAYTGKMNTTGDEITFQVTSPALGSGAGAGPGRPGPQQIVATRAK